MSFKTEDELALEVLQEMGVVDATETSPDSDDAAKVTNAYEILYSELIAPPYELAYWEMATIPSAVFFTLRDLVINEIQGAFGNPMDAAARRDQKEIVLLRLRAHVALEGSKLPVTADYF